MIFLAMGWPDAFVETVRLLIGGAVAIAFIVFVLRGW